MSGFYSFLFLYLTVANDLVNYVTALGGETILGGLPAEPGNFTYQTAILGKQNNSDVVHLIGSGGIIAPDLILTTAQIFIHRNGSLKEYTFVVVVNEINLNYKPEIEILIEEIYMPRDVNLVNMDIAIAKLSKTLELTNNHYWSKLFIPFANENFFNQSGIVTGYGFSSILLGESSNGEQFRLSGIAENKLKYAGVVVIHPLLCEQWFSQFNRKTQICAITLTNDKKKPWGLCEKDAGSPLVIDNKIAGVASRNQPSCHDSEYGCVYTKISEFAFFVDYVIDGNIPADTLIYPNRPHVVPNTCSFWDCIGNSWKIASKKVSLTQKEEELEQPSDE